MSLRGAPNLNDLLVAMVLEHDTEWHKQSLRVALEWMLENHFDEVKSVLDRNELVVDHMADQPEVIEIVKENQWPSFEDSLEEFKRQLRQNPIDAENFRKEIMVDWTKALLPRK